MVFKNSRVCCATKKNDDLSIGSKMKMFYKKVILMIASTMLMTICLADSSTINYVVWQQQPITVALPLNKEKTLQFENPVAVGVPNTLQGKLNISNQSGLVTLTALKAFQPTRIEIKDASAGKTIILDLGTSGSASIAPLAILYKVPTAGEQDDSGWLKTPAALKGEVAYVTLTRYAEQALYGPKRLQRNPYGIQLSQSYVMPDGGVKPNMIFHNLFYDNSTINLPWATWRGGDTYVTAVIVRNVLSTPVDLRRNLTMLCGHDNGTWKAVTFFPNWQLTKAGTEQDSTVAFLVSKIPFHQAQKNCELNNG